MRFIQNILLVIGTTSLGTVSGGLCLMFLVSLLESKKGEWRGYGAYLIGYGCGAPLGAILGCGGAVSWIARGQPRTPWSVATWTGIVLGLSVGLVAAIHWGLTRHWWALVVVAATSGTLGGFLASTVVLLWEGASTNAARQLGPERKKRQRRKVKNGGIRE